MYNVGVLANIGRVIGILIILKTHFKINNFRRIFYTGEELEKEGCFKKAKYLVKCVILNYLMLLCCKFTNIAKCTAEKYAT